MTKIAGSRFGNYSFGFDRFLIFVGSQQDLNVSNFNLHPSFLSYAAALAIGGLSQADHYEASVEVLSFNPYKWNSGPSLPYGISGAVAVETPNGGVILVGGNVTFFHLIWQA